MGCPKATRTFSKVISRSLKDQKVAKSTAYLVNQDQVQPRYLSGHMKLVVDMNDELLQYLMAPRISFIMALLTYIVWVNGS